MTPMIVICAVLLGAILLVGTIIKIYTARQLKDIEGDGPVTTQDQEDGLIIGQFGEDE